MFSKFVVSEISTMIRPLSRTKLPFTYDDSPEIIKSGNTFFSLAARTFNIFDRIPL